VGDKEFVANLIEFIGRDAGPYRLSSRDQRLSSDLAGPPHPVDRFAVLHLGSVERGGAAAPDVLRTGDVHRHRTRRREDSRRELGNIPLLDGVHGQEAYVGGSAMAEERSRA
jgi:hypothetical protein